jgi:hypothetical protein
MEGSRADLELGRQTIDANATLFNGFPPPMNPTLLERFLEVSNQNWPLVHCGIVTFDFPLVLTDGSEM